MKSVSHRFFRPFPLLLALTLVAFLTTGALAAAGTKWPLGKKTMAGVGIEATLVHVANPTYVAMGMGKTHRLVVQLKNQANKRNLTRGLVAIKLQTPDGRFSNPVKLDLEEGAFVTDLTLLEKGQYHIHVACRVLDGRKRQFIFDYSVR